MGCCAGAVWITQENDARDIFLTAGQRFTFDRPGVALIYAEEGMIDEWMNDMGIRDQPAGETESRLNSRPTPKNLQMILGH